jgi:hypothetical protein
MLDFTPMNDFISHVLAAVDQDGAVITKVFPGLAGLIVLYKFTDRLANDVVSIDSTTWSSGTESTEKEHSCFCRWRNISIRCYPSVGCYHRSYS